MRDSAFLICFVFVAHINALSFLRKNKFEESFRLMQSQDPTVDLWLEQRLDNFHPTDFRMWKQVS